MSTVKEDLIIGIGSLVMAGLDALFLAVAVIDGNWLWAVVFLFFTGLMSALSVKSLLNLNEAAKLVGEEHVNNPQFKKDL